MSYFTTSIMCLKEIPKLRRSTEIAKGRRCNFAQVLKWLSKRPKGLKIKTGKAY